MKMTYVTLALLPLFGCAHASQVAKTSVMPTSPPVASQAEARSLTCHSDLDCRSGQLCLKDRCEDITPGMAECSSQRVHFALNSSQLTSEDEASLQRGARCLKATSALHVTIAGNADERGTEEYNMSLGDRRATQVKQYLEALGVSQTQLATVSYGKENPLCEQHDEACWAKNRRADVNLASFKN